ncbi:MAG: endonuclease/exonuclease/phosphatase family protein [Halobacteria archaeon]|nr:endonuclease/exonuclease/phosphatase family protein [Halobacteria archaeon]
MVPWLTNPVKQPFSFIIVHKITYSSRLRYLVVTFAALLLAGCIHVPIQPQLNHSSANSSKQQFTRCTPNISLSQESATAKSGLSPKRISVLSWNMYKQARDNWATDFHRLSHDQDLIILQEAYMDDRLTSVLSESPYNWAMTTAFFYRDNANGVLTASRNKSNRHCALYAKEPLIQTPKSILISTYPMVGTNQYLLVANVHGINFTLGLESYRQQFKALHKVLQNHQGPLILAGDFNSWRNDRQAILDKLSHDLSLQRVGYKSHRRITVFGNPIDHVYYRGLEIVQTSSPSVTSSDHNPLLVTFKVAEPQHKRYAKTP